MNRQDDGRPLRYSYETFHSEAQPSADALDANRHIRRIGWQGGTMNIFISWSGELSKAVAELLKIWLKDVIQVAEPWISSQDISPGATWFAKINEQLKESPIGIFCVTQDNKTKPWLLFEAGALAKGMPSNLVCTLLIDLDAADVELGFQFLNRGNDPNFKFYFYDGNGSEIAINNIYDRQTVYLDELSRFGLKLVCGESYGIDETASLLVVIEGWTK
jgi:hypothetical protein